MFVNHDIQRVKNDKNIKIFTNVILNFVSLNNKLIQNDVAINVKNIDSKDIVF